MNPLPYAKKRVKASGTIRRRGSACPENAMSVRDHVADSLTPLEKLAAANGIEPSWRDNWGEVHPTSPKTSAGLLAAMGVGAATAAEARRSLAAHRRPTGASRPRRCSSFAPLRRPGASRSPCPALPDAPDRGPSRVSIEIRRGGGRRRHVNLIPRRDLAPRDPHVPRARLGPLRNPAARHPSRSGTTPCTSWPGETVSCCGGRWR